MAVSSTMPVGGLDITALWYPWRLPSLFAIFHTSNAKESAKRISGIWQALSNAERRSQRRTHHAVTRREARSVPLPTVGEMLNVWTRDARFGPQGDLPYKNTQTGDWIYHCRAFLLFARSKSCFAASRGPRCCYHARLSKIVRARRESPQPQILHTGANDSFEYLGIFEPSLCPQFLVFSEVDATFYLLERVMLAKRRGGVHGGGECSRFGTAGAGRG